MVKLDKIPCFSNTSKLDILLRLLQTRSNITPREIAAATGCTLIDSMQVLLVLSEEKLAAPFLLVYHNQHPNTVIEARGLEEGFPQTPLVCDICDEIIEDGNHLSYDFSFSLSSTLATNFE